MVPKVYTCWAVSGAKASGELVDGLMNGAAVPLDVVVGGYELLEWRIDVVEINVGDEAIDARIDAGRFRTMQITARREKIGKRPEIGEPARHCGVGIVAADSLVVIAFGVELLRLGYLLPSRSDVRGAWRRETHASNVCLSNANTTSPNRGRRAFG